MDSHLWFAWLWILAGLLSGAVIGWFFAREDWLGGYAAWPLRLVRLGHVAFVGTGLLNLGICWTLAQLQMAPVTEGIVRGTFIAGAVAMPLCCFAAALRGRAKLWFVLPVSALCAGTLVLVVQGTTSPPLAGRLPALPALQTLRTEVPR